MIRRIITLLVLLLVFQVGCSPEKNMGSNLSEKAIYTSSISSENCFLCREDTSHIIEWGQNNIGIICLNTFEVIPIEINRYDWNGNLIERNSGNISMHTFKNKENDFWASLMIDPDRGHADVSMSLYVDETLDIEKVAAFLCQNCLNKLIDSIHQKALDVGIINFKTKELRVFEESVTGFGLGDFYIHCDLKDTNKTSDSRKLDLVIFYCPLRYENET